MQQIPLSQYRMVATIGVMCALDEGNQIDKVRDYIFKLHFNDLSKLMTSLAAKPNTHYNYAQMVY